MNKYLINNLKYFNTRQFFDKGLDNYQGIEYYYRTINILLIINMEVEIVYIS